VRAFSILLLIQRRASCAADFQFLLTFKRYFPRLYCWLASKAVEAR
jgi:hypothetical protein